MKIWAKTEEYREGKFLVVRRDGSVPHWPHFVLGARDPFAPAALRAYAEACRAGGFGYDYCQSLLELASDFETYRAEQGEGDPEAAPHRIDNEDVLKAMRGGTARVLVRPDKENVKK